MGIILPLDVHCPRCEGSCFEYPPLWRAGMFVLAINPLSPVSELMLGQRFPKDVVICSGCEEPLAQRSYVYCSRCHALSDGQIWSGWNAFGHWFGLMCPHCFGQLPQALSLLSRAILILTFPVWALLSPWIRDRWLKFDRARLMRKKMRPMFSGVFRLLAAFSMVGGITLWLLVSVVSYGFKRYLGGEPSNYLSDLMGSAPVLLPICLIWGLITGGLVAWWGRTCSRTVRPYRGTRKRGP